MKELNVGMEKLIYTTHNGKLIEQAGTVLLATGFKPSLPGEEWLSPVIDTLPIVVVLNVAIPSYRGRYNGVPIYM